MQKIKIKHRRKLYCITQVRFLQVQLKFLLEYSLKTYEIQLKSSHS